MSHASRKHRWAASDLYRGLATLFALLIVSSGGSVAAADGDRQSGDVPQTAVRTAGSGDSESEAKEHPLVDALKLAGQSQEALSKVQDYEATFFKKELVGRSVIPLKMLIRQRSEPFSVYLRFLEAHRGREVLYVANQNNGRLLAREASGIKSLVGTVELLPNSAEAMAEGRYPITEIGMHKMLEAVIKQWESELEFGETTVEYYPDATIGEMHCIAIVSQHPVPRRQFRFHKTMLFIDRKTHFPVHLQQYGFPKKDGQQPPLVEEYTYDDIKINLGLTDQDFSRNNKSYGFR